jgi:hypothetical protein
MAKLIFVSLKCHKTDDSGEDNLARLYDIGVEDEPYLLVDRNKVWSGRMKANDEVSFTGIESIPFEDQVHVELWDRDAGPENGKNDNIGDLIILSAQAGLGEQSQQFKTRIADYTLVYQVE